LYVLCGKECICVVHLYYLAGFLRGAGADILKGPLRARGIIIITLSNVRVRGKMNA